MIPVDAIRVYLALGTTDMRKAINGLPELVEQAMGLDPFSGDLFVFCNRRKNIHKILYWDENGFCLWHKRLEEHRFQWSRRPEQIMAIDRRLLNRLLAGLDFASAHQQFYYRKAG